MIEQLFTRPGMLTTDPKRAFHGHYFTQIWEVIQDLMDAGVEPLEHLSPEITETFVFGWMFGSVGGEFDADQPFYRDFRDASLALEFAKKAEVAPITQALQDIVDGVASIPEETLSTLDAFNATEFAAIADGYSRLREQIEIDFSKADYQELRHGPILARCLEVAREICPIEVVDQDEFDQRIEGIEKLLS